MMCWRSVGRRGWCRSGLGRFEENHRVDLAAHEAFDRWRATARDMKGRVLEGNSKPFTPPQMPERVINLRPDSRVMRTQGTPPRQAYNAQTTVNEQQTILAAEIAIDAPDFGHLEPMLVTTLQHLDDHGVSEQPDVVLADAGYWNTTGSPTPPDTTIAGRNTFPRERRPSSKSRSLRFRQPLANALAGVPPAG